MTLTADFNPSVNVTFARMRMLLAEQGGGIQEGVVGATDLKVAQRGAGANMSVDVPAGAAWVQIDTGTRNGLAHVYNDATANVTVTASNGTNPRIDQIILRYNDSNIPTGTGNVPTLEVLTGTATGGATLDNRTGAAALPNDCLRLADILVPAASSSVVTANIRDRRPWARGAYNRITKSTVSTTTSASMVLVDGAVFSVRIECSGVPIRISLRGPLSHSVAGGQVYLAAFIDGADIGGGTGLSNPTVITSSGAGTPITPYALTTFVPSAGSHVFDWRWAVAGFAGTGTLNATANQPVEMIVEEIVRPNANNS